MYCDYFILFFSKIKCPGKIKKIQGIWELCPGNQWFQVGKYGIEPTKKSWLAPAYFALIIIIVVYVVKHQSVLINTCRRQESLRMMKGSPSIIIIAS